MLRGMTIRVDLRSDTVTKPSPPMREAMAQAEVGDDIFQEDPTVRALEEKTAALLGKESALFVPSGTMANQIALSLHCRPGDAAFITEDAHLARYESGAASAYAGAQLVTVPPADAAGPFDRRALADAIYPDAYYLPKPRLVCFENTHNQSGGRIAPQEEVVACAALARERGLGVHLDGARLWNASVASETSPAELAAPADTVSVCFSKGLGAPVGSALAMPAAMRPDALRLRRRMGGAMRQSGILAAAAIHALDHHLRDLRRDHDRARALAEGLATHTTVRAPQTNIVAFEADDAAGLVARAAEAGVLLVPIGPRLVRAVTHRDLPEDAVARALEVLGALL